MALLVVKNSMEKYLERMKFSASAKVQTKLVLKRFDTFCHRTQNKAELSFDLGDCLLMGCNYFRSSNVKIVSVPLGNQHNSFTKSDSEFVCSSCKLDIHSNSSHSMWVQDEEDLRTVACRCDKCLS